MSEAERVFSKGDKVRDRFSREAGTITAKETVKGYHGIKGTVDIDNYTVKSDVDGIERFYAGPSNLLPALNR
jgi:hypothetical protein